MSLVLCTTTTANGPTGNDNNNNTDNISDDSNPVTIYRFGCHLITYRDNGKLAI